MPFSKTYQEIKEMILNTALSTQMARDIVRRSGLRPGETSRPVTVINDYVSADQPPLRMQWTADLTEFSRVRFASNSPDPVYVMYSSNTSTTDYDPGDYTVLTALNVSEESVSVSSSSEATPEWLTLPDDVRVALRFVLSTSSSGVSSTLGSSAFTSVLQVS